MKNIFSFPLPHFSHSLDDIWGLFSDIDLALEQTTKEAPMTGMSMHTKCQHPFPIFTFVTGFLLIFS